MLRSAAPRAVLPTRRLEWIEVGRGLAALAVVVFHANASADQYGGPNLGWLNVLAHGIDFFFVLSGFVILHAHARDIDRPDRLRRYALKRAIRLLPTLWMVVGGWALIRWTAGAGPDPATVARSLLPYPSLAPTIPNVVWTLRHEIVFYVLFAVLIVSRRAGLALFTLWLGLVVAQIVAALGGGAVTGLPAFFVAGYSGDFMLGMAIYLLHSRWPARPCALPLAAGLLLLTGIAVALDEAGRVRLGMHDYSSAGATWGALALGIGFAAVLYGLVRLEGLAKAPRALLALGACSYALYLVHTPVNSFAQIAARQLAPGLKAVGAGHLLLIAGGVLAAWLLYRLAEKPMMEALERATGVTRVPDSQSTARTHLR